MHHLQPEPARRLMAPLIKPAVTGADAASRQTLTDQIELPLSLLRPAVALLVDGENSPPDLVETALAEADKYGPVRVRRVYANWSVLGQRGWGAAITRHRLEPIHHERTAVGKNATDIALVVDAMDLLYRESIACFCLLASDSDYTPLVERLRAANRVVVGLGRPQTPPSLTRACSVFIPLERPGAPAAPRPLRMVATAAPPAAAPPAAAPPASDPAPLLLSAWGELARACGEVSLANLVSEVKLLYPNLDLAEHGNVRLATLIRQRSDLFTVRQSGRDPNHMLVDRVDRRVDVRTLLVTAWQRAEKQGCWLNLSLFGSQLRKIEPSFSPSTYGHGQLKNLILAHEDLFEISLRSDAGCAARLRAAASAEAVSPAW